MERTLRYSEQVKAERAAIADVAIDGGQMKQDAMKKAEILMYEGAFDIDSDGVEEDCWIWIANGKHVLRVIETPYWHGRKSYSKIVYIKSPGEFYGINYFEWIERIWMEICDKHNQALDSVNLSINSPILAGVGAGLDQNQLMLSPGKVIRLAGTVQELMPLTIPDHSEQAYKAIAVLQNIARETSGATDLLQAQDSGGVDKATIYAGMLNEANLRIKHSLRNIFEGIERVADLYYALDQQYLDAETSIRILGKSGFEFRPVRPEDVSGMYDFIGIGTGTLSSMAQKNMGMMQFVQSFGPLMLNGLVRADFNEIAKRVWTDLLGYTDAARIFGEQGPQPMDPEQENMLLAQRQAVDVHPQDDHIAHVKTQMPLLGHQDPVVRQMARQHIQEHQVMFQRLMAAQEAMVQYQTQMAMNQLAAAAPQPTNGTSNGNGGPMTRAAGTGNQQQAGAEMGQAKEIGELLSGRMG